MEKIRLLVADLKDRNETTELINHYREYPTSASASTSTSTSTSVCKQVFDPITIKVNHPTKGVMLTAKSHIKLAHPCLYNVYTDHHKNPYYHRRIDTSDPEITYDHSFPYPKNRNGDVYHVVIMVISKDNFVLCLKSADRDTLGFPKGYIDYQATSEIKNIHKINPHDPRLTDHPWSFHQKEGDTESALRELNEESGLKPTDGQLVLLNQTEYVSQYVFLYNQHAKNYNPNTIDECLHDHEIEKILWLPFAELNNITLNRFSRNLVQHLVRTFRERTLAPTIPTSTPRPIAPATPATPSVRASDRPNDRYQHPPVSGRRGDGKKQKTEADTSKSWR